MRGIDWILYDYKKVYLKFHLLSIKESNRFQSFEPIPNLMDEKEKYRKRKMALAHARYGERKGVSILKRKWEERAKWNKKAIRDTRNHT